MHTLIISFFVKWSSVSLALQQIKSDLVATMIYCAYRKALCNGIFRHSANQSDGGKIAIAERYHHFTVMLMFRNKVFDMDGTRDNRRF